MTRLPRIAAASAEARLKLLGFFLVRQRGSHRIYENAAGKCVVVPFHTSKILHPKVLKTIMKQAGIEYW